MIMKCLIYSIYLLIYSKSFISKKKQILSIPCISDDIGVSLYLHLKKLKGHG